MSHNLSDLKDFFRPHSSGTGAAVATGIISAVAAAGITYFLFGTDKGSEEREKMREGFGKLKGKAKTLMTETTELATVGKEMAGDMKSILKERADVLTKVDKAQISALADRVRTHWEEIREDIEDTLDKVADDADDEAVSNAASL